jgi:hypothetical protein
VENNNESSKAKRIAIITFKYSNSKDIMARHNAMDIAKKIRHVLKCCPNKNKFILTNENTGKSY